TPIRLMGDLLPCPVRVRRADLPDNQREVDVGEWTTPRSSGIAEAPNPVEKPQDNRGVEPQVARDPPSELVGIFLSRRSPPSTVLTDVTGPSLLDPLRG